VIEPEYIGVATSAGPAGPRPAPGTPGCGDTGPS